MARETTSVSHRGDGLLALARGAPVPKSLGKPSHWPKLPGCRPTARSFTSYPALNYIASVSRFTCKQAARNDACTVSKPLRSEIANLISPERLPCTRRTNLGLDSGNSWPILNKNFSYAEGGRDLRHADPSSLLAIEALREDEVVPKPANSLLLLVLDCNYASPMFRQGT